ncbi:MAG: sensor histidine kinase, partial [Bacteroidota bacterium]
REELNEQNIENLKAEYQIKYETGKKEQEILAQQAALKAGRRIQLLTVALLSLLALILAGLFWSYRRNQQRSKLLEAKNQENELLLKEIHHRVKNNLEMVSSLLKLQAVKTKDASAKEVMQASQNRVQSMGIIHQKLYQGEKLASVEMLDYFQNLSENIIDAFGAHDQVAIRYDMKPLEVDVDTAVPIGLIVNELLTNSMKYAFPEGKKGEIALSLKETEPNRLHLVVADNGVGKLGDTPIKGTGFGSQLVQLLTIQLQGTMQTDYQKGTKFSFLLDKANVN